MAKIFQDMESLSLKNYEKIRHGFKCPLCGEPMVERTNSRTGENFFGCTDFPNCTGTRNEDGVSTVRGGEDNFDPEDQVAELDGELKFPGPKGRR